MDCRKSLLFLLPLFTCFTGCVTTSTNDVSPKAAADPQQKARLLVAAADCAMKQASNPTMPPAQQQQIREDSRRNYELALSVSPKYAPALEGLARLYAQMGDFARANEMYQKAIAAAPQDARLRYQYGWYLGQRKEWPGAVAAFREACKIEPANHQYAKTLGFTLARAGLVDESLACFHSIGMSAAEAEANIARMQEHVQGHGHADAEMQAVDLQSGD